MKHWWPGALAVLLGLLVFSSSFPGAFHFDDRPLLLENPDVTGEDFDHRFFLLHYGGRPLTLWTFHWNFKLAGDSALAFHSVNVFLHLATVGVVFLLILEIAGRRTLAFLAAVLFAIHPLQTQAVNYVWSRSVLLMSLFGLLSVLLVRRHRWLGLMCFQLAIWSRAEALCLVFLLVFLTPSRWRPVGVLALANGVVFFWGLVLTEPAEMGWSHPDALGYWAAQPVMFWKYAQLMFWPSGLAIDHSPGSYHWSLELLAAGTLGFLLMVFARWKTTQPVLCFAGLWLVIPLVPSWLIPNSDWFNESRAYLSVGGFALLVSWVILRIPGLPGWRGLAGAILVSALGLTSFERNKIWNDDVALWRDAVEKSPSKARARYNLGSALARQSLVDQARPEFAKALDLNPVDDMSYAALGFCAEFEGDQSTALDFYAKAVKLNPDNRYAREGLARITRKSTPGSTRPLEPSERPFPISGTETDRKR